MKDTAHLKALDSFECTGSKCPRSCCSGWQIEVEQTLLEKWQQHPDKDERDWLLNTLPENKKGRKQVLMEESDLRCPFLNKENLCNIQIQHDQSFIPATCREYPRVNIDTTNRQYQSAYLSCPEIVRLTLFSKQYDNPYTTSHANNTTANQQQNPHEQINFSLDKLLNKVLKLDQFPLGLRLFYISNFFSDFFDYVKQNDIQPEQINQIGKQLKDILKDAGQAVRQKQIIVDPVTAGSYWQSIYAHCNTFDIDARFMEDKTSPLTNCLINCDNTHAGFTRIYSSLKDYLKHCQPIIKKHYQTLVKTYTQVYFKNNGLPLLPRHKTTNITLVQCMIGLSIFQLLLWMQIKQHGKLDDMLLQELIVEIQRKMAHNDAIARHLESNPHMLQIGQYCTCFIDMF